MPVIFNLIRYRVVWESVLMVSSLIPILDNAHVHNVCAYMCGMIGIGINTRTLLNTRNFRLGIEVLNISVSNCH